MPTPTPSYRWNRGAGRYIRGNGQFVAFAEVRGALDDVLTQATREMKALATQLQAGTLTLAEWQRETEGRIKTIHLVSAAAALGGWAQMTPADFGRVGDRVKREYEWFERLATQIASGEQKLDGRFMQRVELFAQAGRKTYHAFETERMRVRGWDEEANVLGVADHCDGQGSCLGETRRRWVPIGALIPIGERRCLTRCQCRKRYRNSTTGEVTE